MKSLDRSFWKEGLARNSDWSLLFHHLMNVTPFSGLTSLILCCRDEEMLLDISTLEPREAIKLLKLHLSNLAGISSKLQLLLAACWPSLLEVTVYVHIMGLHCSSYSLS